MRSSTTDYLVLPIESGVPLEGLPIEVSFSRFADEDGPVWFATDEVDGGVQVLIGPDSAVGPFAPGIWWASLRIATGLGPRRPHFSGGAFVIEGGDASVSEPGGGVDFDIDGVPYFSPQSGGGAQLLADTDGTPYVEES